jgi:hypothetical protein
MSRTFSKAGVALVFAAQFFVAHSCWSADRNVKIEFLPPPMEGTISLGVYNGEGKLVRTLAREAEVKEFTAALN